MGSPLQKGTIMRSVALFVVLVVSVVFAGSSSADPSASLSVFGDLVRGGTIYIDTESSVITSDGLFRPQWIYVSCFDRQTQLYGASKAYDPVTDPLFAFTLLPPFGAAYSWPEGVDGWCSAKLYVELRSQWGTSYPKTLARTKWSAPG